MKFYGRNSLTDNKHHIMSKQSEILDKQMKDLAEVAALLDDNKTLQDQLDRRIAALGRTKAVIEAKEQREAEEAAMRLKLADAEDAVAKRIKEAVDHIGKSSDEKKQAKDVLESASLVNTDVLDKFDYLRGKGLTVDQIKLVLGL